MGAYLSALVGRFLCRSTTVRHTQQNYTYREIKVPLSPTHEPFNEKTLLPTTPSNTSTLSIPKTDAQLADKFSGLLLFSRTLPIFRSHLSATFPPPPTATSDFSTTDWTPSLALAILNAITAAIDAGVPLGAAKEVVETAKRDVEGWIEENPVMAGVVAMVVALGVLVVVAPWVVEGLGFGGLGHIEAIERSKPLMTRSLLPSRPLVAPKPLAIEAFCTRKQAIEAIEASCTRKQAIEAIEVSCNMKEAIEAIGVSCNMKQAIEAIKSILRANTFRGALHCFGFWRKFDRLLKKMRK
ncbi:hypothetical protein VE02_07257 [Pseudogymnoascus sp. 03VT05]|nr:hypothetical protein VE02_07257 [Pseudogymnoascus sp. 03VT05]